MELHFIGCCLAHLIHNRQLDASVSFIVRSRGSDHCDRLSTRSSHHRLLHLTDMQRRRQRWQSYRRRVGLALIGQEENKTPFIFTFAPFYA